MNLMERMQFHGVALVAFTALAIEITNAGGPGWILGVMILIYGCICIFDDFRDMIAERRMGVSTV